MSFLVVLVEIAVGKQTWEARCIQVLLSTVYGVLVDVDQLVLIDVALGFVPFD